MAGDKGKLTYFEYWLTKDIWTLEQGVFLLQNYYCHTRRWSESDDHGTVRKAYFDKISDCIDKTIKPESLVSSAIDRTRGPEIRYSLEYSKMDRVNFIRWAFDSGFEMPEEFLYEIGEIEEVKPVNSNYNEFAAQAVAKLLWDIDPNMQTKEIAEHVAVTDYCKAGSFTEETRRRWISKVDPRRPEKKTGPKKKI
jgi:hypothetical protein